MKFILLITVISTILIIGASERIIPPYVDAGGPVSFDWSIGPKLWKELQGGIVRFYASNLLIMVQHVRQAAPDSMAENLEVIKSILGRILRGGTPYHRELYDLGRAFASIRNQNVRTFIDTGYSSTPGPSLEIDEDNSSPMQIISRVWGSVQSWTRRLVGANQLGTDKSDSFS